MESSSLQMFQQTVKTVDSFIFIKPVCDFFQIDYENQCRVITKDETLKTEATKKSSELLFGDKRERYTLSKRGFIIWLQTINPQIVQVSLREKLIQYKLAIFDFFFGTLEREEQVQIDYKRREKAKRVAAYAARMYRMYDKKIQDYLQGRYNQAELGFKKPLQISAGQ